MTVYSYQSWVIWVYVCGSGYSIQCLSPDLEIYTDWQIYPSPEVALKAAKQLVDQDDKPDSGLYNVVALMSGWGNSETVSQENFAALECQGLAVELGGMSSAMLGILASLTYLHTRINGGNSC